MPPSYTLAQRAAADIERIARETLEQLGQLPNLGRPADTIRPGIHRLEYASHVILYRPAPPGVLILRVLHQRMLPTSHL